MIAFITQGIIPLKSPINYGSLLGNFRKEKRQVAIMYVDQDTGLKDKLTTGFAFSIKKHHLYYQPSMVCNSNND